MNISTQSPNALRAHISAIVLRAERLAQLEIEIRELKKQLPPLDGEVPAFTEEYAVKAQQLADSMSEDVGQMLFSTLSYMGDLFMYDERSRHYAASTIKLVEGR